MFAVALGIEESFLHRSSFYWAAPTYGSTAALGFAFSSQQGMPELRAWSLYLGLSELASLDYGRF